MKRYVREPGSTLVRRVLALEPAATSRLSQIEIACAVARRAREGRLTLGERDRVLTAVESDFAALLVVELAPAVCVRAGALLRGHPLRASDAVQLASCLYLQGELDEQVRFVAFDERLNAAARAEGVEVVSAHAPARFARLRPLSRR